MGFANKLGVSQFSPPTRYTFQDDRLKKLMFIINKILFYSYKFRGFFCHQRAAVDLIYHL